MNLRRLKLLINHPESRSGRVFELTIQVLIVASMIAFSVETIPTLPAYVRHGLFLFEAVSVAVFTFEYALRVMAAERKHRFVFSFFGVIDVLAVLPFYITLIAGASGGVDLRTLRAFRLLRLFRVFKLVRYSRAIRRFQRAFGAAREEIILYLCLTAILLYFSAVGIYQFEHEAQPEAFSSVFSSLWWAVTTLTTVGYGDVYPVTPGGRLFTFLVLMAGLGVVSVPAGLVAAALENARAHEDERSPDDDLDDEKADGVAADEASHSSDATPEA